MGRHLLLVLKNLRRNKRRTFLTVVSTSLSVCLVGMLVAVYGALYARDVSEESAQRLVTRHKVSLGQVMPTYYRSRIAAIDGVRNVVPMNWFGGTYIDSRPENMFARFAVDQEEIFNIYSELKVPADQLEAFQRDRQAIAIGSSVAERTGLKLGQRITLVGDIYQFDPELTVRAIFEGPDDFQSFFHQKYLEEGLRDQPGGGSFAGVFALRLRSADDASRVAMEVDEMFRNAPEPTKTETEAAFQLSFITQLGNVKLFLLAIAAAIVFTMLMVSANTVAMSVRERIREIGVLKTLGFDSASVLGLILAEALLISIVGGILGTLLVPGVGALAVQVMGPFIPTLVLPTWGIAVCILTALAVGLCSSAVPATVAARTNIVDALRHAG